MKLTLNLTFALVLLSASAFGQLVTLTQTTLSAAVGAGSTTLRVASATGITATVTNPSYLYVLDPGGQRGELMKVTSVSGTNIGVVRGLNGTASVGHISGAIVVIGRGQDFPGYNPSGACTASTAPVFPWINPITGEQWICSSVSSTWVPGWHNPASPSATATVASAAGAILPSGPLFSVSGTAAVTGFTIPVGFASGEFCVVPTGAFTWTAAGNINTAGTAVVGRTLCFTWSTTASKFVASYL